MITRKKKENDFNSPDTMFEPPVAEVFEDNDHNDEGNGGDKNDALAKQLSDLQNQMVELQRANAALLASPQSFNNNDTFPPADPNKVALPDPALDPDGYERAVAQRIEIREDNRRRKDETERRRATDVEEKVEDLWNSFGEKYP